MLVFFEGCFNNEANNDTKGQTQNKSDCRLLQIDFKEGTNESYIHYLEEKYNITLFIIGGRKDGSITTCECILPVELANKYKQLLEREELVEMAVFDDVYG